MHRYLFHEWQLLRPVHAAPHRKYLTAPSLYVHPVENALGCCC
jgi:hypothetical protein